MRRWVIAAIGASAIVLVIAATGMVVTADDDDGHHPTRGTMSGSSWDGSGWMQRPGGWMGRWMPGAGVDGEFEYLSEMMAHHEEAVAAAKEQARSNRSEMRAFGAGIVATQSAQIEQMREWLARWYPGRSTYVDYRPMMRDLSGLLGDRLDRVFLEDMIGHHMVAVMMSQQLLIRGLADHGEVNELAQSIRDDQHGEIIHMRRWLADWFDTGWGMAPGMLSMTAPS